jgi:hypothetical protein
MKLLNDSELFVEHATWLGPYLPQPTMGAFACWLAPWLRQSSKRALESIIRLNHPAQLAAEPALVALLKAALARTTSQRVARPRCERNVDWASTVANAHPFPPTSFVHTQAAPELDRGTLSGLATVARQWAFLLVEYAGYYDTHERVRSLRRAAKPFGSGQLTLGHLRRLARSPGELGTSAAVLRPALELASRQLTDSESRAALIGLREQLAEAGRQELENQEDALEVTVILSIARAAQACGWTVSAARADSTRRKPEIRLARGAMRCAINKGQYRYPADPKKRVVDVLAEMERTALGLTSGSRQPDVVISFWRADAPEDVLFCIADAKRNESGDGVAYLKKSVTAMVAYMVAFAEPLRVRLSAEHGGFVAPLMPVATLFLHQGIAREQEQGSPGCAWIQAFERSRYACVADDRNGFAPELQRWFEQLCKRAERPR